MEFRLLGPLEVLHEGRAIALGGPKRRALLALLLLQTGDVVSSDRLVDELWGEEPPATAVTALHNHVCRLRKALGAGVLVTRPGGYALQLDGHRVDLERFHRLVRDAEGAEPVPRAAKLHEALDLWRGQPLADVDLPFLQTEVLRLEDLRLAALEDRIDADLVLGRHAYLVPELERLVAEHRFRERLRGQLMVALYRCERQADALAVYQDGRTFLAEELGLEPGPELRELERCILLHDVSLAFSPTASEPTRATRAFMRLPWMSLRKRRRRGSVSGTSSASATGSSAR